MNTLKVPLRMIFASLFFITAAPDFAESAERSGMIAAQDQKKEKASGPGASTQEVEEKPGSSDEMPVYKPPLRGAPGGRVGGGTRGVGDERLFLSVLAPDHVGLTTRKQPSIYWFISALPARPIEFTFIENKAIKPLLEKRLDPPRQAGIQCIRLADYGLNLQADVVYQWFVTLVTDPDQRSKDTLSGGAIQRIDSPRGLQEKLDKESKRKGPHIYADAGLWYDAMMAVSEMIEASPKEAALLRIRASLLEQVGLHPIAEHDKK